MKAAVAVARKAEAEERERLKRQEKKERAAWRKAEEKAELEAKALAVSCTAATGNLWFAWPVWIRDRIQRCLGRVICGWDLVFLLCPSCGVR